jgi:hypothetical protein
VNTKPKDGGPAYPVVGMSHEGGQPVEQVLCGGMTMRQAYKIAALQGLLEQRYNTGQTLYRGDQNPALIAKEVGELADAMLAEDEEHAKK